MHTLLESYVDIKIEECIGKFIFQSKHIISLNLEVILYCQLSVNQ